MRKALRFIVGTNFVRGALVSFSLAIVAVSGVSAYASAAQPPPDFTHYAVSTKNAAAQGEFDQGLTLLYAFNPEEATFHFQQAARLDASFAMAFWGIGLAAGPNVNTDYDLQRAAIGREAVAQARLLDAHASASERGLIEALAKRYEAANTAQILGAETAYANAMRILAHRYPNDLRVTTLAAESLMDLTPLAYWLPDGKPNRYTQEIIGLLDGVLKRDPADLGANHYLIHVYEYSAQPQQALESARRLAHLSLPPGAEHLAHMPAHIFTRLGDYDDAIAASLSAATMFRRYVGQEHSDVHNSYFHHDLQVLDYAYMMSGQWTKARDTATEISDQVQDNGAAVETYVRFHRWHELLALAPPAQPGLRWRFAQGMAAAGTGDLGAARTAVASIETLHDSDPRTGIAQALLGASVAAAEHQDAAAIAGLRHAVALEDGLRLKEPPVWFYPIRETLGARLAMTGQFGQAQRVFEDDLQRNPQNPRSLFGLAQVLAKTDAKRAASVQAAFTRAWHHADQKLTLSDL